MMQEFLKELDRRAEKGKFKLVRMRDNREQIVLEVTDFSTALDIISAFREAGPFRIYNDVASVCHGGY